jgi:exopolysaccharide biosynthesis polyprenyl glycosylphosphotransferase
VATPAACSFVVPQCETRFNKFQTTIIRASILPARVAAGRIVITDPLMSSTQYPGATPLSSVIAFSTHAAARPVASAESAHRVEIAISLVERILDFLAVVGAVWSAYWIHAAWREGARPHYSNDAVLVAAAGFALLMVLLLDKHGDYRPCLSLLAVRETERLMRVTIASFLLALPILLAVTKLVPRTAIALALVMVPLLLAIEKWHTHKAIRMIRGWGAASRKTVIFGTGTLGRSVYSTLVRSPKLGFEPVAFVSDRATVTEPVIYEESYQRQRQTSVLPGPLTPKMLHRLGANVLVIAAPEISAEETADITARAEAAGISTYIIPEPFLDPGIATDYVELDGVLLAHKAPVSRRRLYHAAKRAVDVSVSASLLLALAPLLAVAAVAVKLTSVGPTIFKQQRVGQDGAYFSMYKFRSMYADSERYAYSPKSGSDVRITPVGRFLRRTCIDELPQLANVLQGKMSLVGPRPEMPFIVEQYKAIHRQRLTVKPGITGLWQLSADRRSLIHENVSYDLYYVRRCNFLMDVAILLHTVVFAFRGV